MPKGNHIDRMFHDIRHHQRESHEALLLQQQTAITLLSAVLAESLSRLARIERRLVAITRVVLREEAILMATRDTDQQLVNEVHAMTDRVAAVETVITALTASNAELTQKLDDAINSGDEAAMQAALTEIKANNDRLAALAPVLATAAVNVDPTVPAPTI